MMRDASTRVAGLLGMMLWAGGSAHAAAYGGVSLGVGASDNISLSATTKQSETMGSVGADFSIASVTSRTTTDAMADLAYVKYFDDTYPADLSGYLQGVFVAQLVPGRVRWTVEDNFGQARADQLRAGDPGNLENINLFSTGPDIGLIVRQNFQLSVFGRYSRESHELQPLDSDRYMYGAQAQNMLSGVSSISLNHQIERIDYTAAADDAVDTQETFASYDLAAARTTLVVDFGVNSVKQFGITDPGILARIRLSRSLTGSASLALAGGHELTDSASSFRVQQNLNVPNSGNVFGAQTSLAFQTNYVSLELTIAKPRTSFLIGARHHADIYEQQPTLDQRRDSGLLQITRTITPKVRLSVSADYLRTDFVQSLGDNQEWKSEVRLAWQPTRLLSLSVEYLRVSRKEDVLSQGWYSENRGWVRLRYGSTLPAL